MPLIALVIAPNAGRLVDRIGPRLPAVLGAGALRRGPGPAGAARAATPAWSTDHVAHRLHRRRHGLRHADPLGRLDGVAAAPGARRRFGLAQHPAPGGLHARRRACSSRSSPTPWRPTPRRPRNSRSPTCRLSRRSRPQQKRPSHATISRTTAAAAASGGGDAATVLVKDPLHRRAAGARRHAAGRDPQQMSQVTVAIFRDDIAKSFKWPFYVAALAALLAIFPALLTGRRLGEHDGHEKLDEAGRAAGEAAAPAGPRRPARRPTPSSDRPRDRRGAGRQRCRAGRRPAHTGRRPGESGARDDILAAARTEFAEDGYDGATIRGIAARADVDPALVHHYFGAKEQLFEAAVELPVSPADASATDPRRRTRAHRRAGGAALPHGLGGAAQPADLPGHAAFGRCRTSRPPSSCGACSSRRSSGRSHGPRRARRRAARHPGRLAVHRPRAHALRRQGRAAGVGRRRARWPPPSARPSSAISPGRSARA